MQLSALPQLLQWLSAQNDDSSNELLHNRLDMARVAVAGHSRGGKLAALQFAQGGRWSLNSSPAWITSAGFSSPANETTCACTILR
jgi:acetyl esterase/lipase